MIQIMCCKGFSIYLESSDPVDVWKHQEENTLSEYNKNQFKLPASTGIGANID